MTKMKSSSIYSRLTNVKKSQNKSVIAGKPSLDQLDLTLDAENISLSEEKIKSVLGN